MITRSLLNLAGFGRFSDKWFDVCDQFRAEVQRRDGPSALAAVIISQDRLVVESRRACLTLPYVVVGAETILLPALGTAIGLRDERAAASAFIRAEFCIEWAGNIGARALLISAIELALGRHDHKTASLLLNVGGVSARPVVVDAILKAAAVTGSRRRMRWAVSMGASRGAISEVGRIAIREGHYWTAVWLFKRPRPRARTPQC